ncbi:Leucine--tRNA ligase [Aphelenchoides besseyi]|nr:Leucine--tRNA ligase [Aphelenchoides besseyi]
MSDAKERRKVNQLLEIEETVHQLWDAAKPFEVDAPEDDQSTEDKFLITFPFPYMNGRLHVGHTFSLSKAEFAVGFERMRGKRALFPFAFHATGMPIKACADKLKFEIEKFGNPPQFPTDDVEEQVESLGIAEVMANKTKSKKSKAVAKSGNAKHQWTIMQSLGLTDEQIAEFADENHWLDYFPDYCIRDLKSMGVKADFRRSFMTTDRNQFFDAFVRWQFRKLRSLNLIDFGKRYSIYSPKDGQPCMDHDRSSGVGPQEYTLIKIRVVSELPAGLSRFGLPVFLVAATLRPETMYGQTNCFVHPDLTYSAFRTRDNEIFVTTKRAARNMSFQGFTEKEGGVDFVVDELKGRVFLGAKLEAPLCTYEHVYALPMLGIKEDKGTGVVTSVPSDAPDDLVTLNELKRKPEWRKKWGLSDEMVLPFEPVPIIRIKDLGDLSAVRVVEAMKIESPNDKQKLEEAKKEVYMKGFYGGELLVGKYKGKKTEEVKKVIQQELIDSGKGARYQEPEKPVVSRSGDDCVVALCDQWYLDYGNERWKEKAKRVVEEMETFGDEVRKNLLNTIDWLHEYACSRLFGLGTRLPWDERWVIESLSDSTIYTSYYSIAHILQKGSLDGNVEKLDVRPDQLNDAFFDFVFLDGSFDGVNVPKEVAERCKREFAFWRAPDVRVSGKDLVTNHLTFYIFNHCAIFGDNKNKWPKGIRANGHLMLNNEKMSKSTGNFLTLSEAVQQFSADGMRLALADAGDGIEDANFSTQTADRGLLRLHLLIENAKEWLKRKEDGNYRKGERTVVDRYFHERFHQQIQWTYDAYARTEYKNALKFGLYEFQLSRDAYRQMCGGSEEEMHVELVDLYLDAQVRILAPICPHVCEHIWQLMGAKTLIVAEKWPQMRKLDETLLVELDFILETIKMFRAKLEDQKKVKAKKGDKNARQKAATIYVAKTFPPWQAEVVEQLNGLLVDAEFPDGRKIAEKLKGTDAMKKHGKKVMSFVQLIKEEFVRRGAAALQNSCSIDQRRVLESITAYVRHATDVEDVKFVDVDHSAAQIDDAAEKAAPFKPWIQFEF